MKPPNVNANAAVGATQAHELEKGPKHSSKTDSGKTLEDGESKMATNEAAPQSSELVDWGSDSDPQKPMNWTFARKTQNIAVICYSTFLTPLGSTMFAPAMPQVMQTFHSKDPLLASFTVSIWVLGYFVGPLFLGPLSEMYGRLPMYLICNVLFCVSNVATALSPNLSALIVFRFFAGIFGGCPITIGAGTFGDLVRQERRGIVIAIWSLGPLLGPILGPIAGGYLGQAEGWRWICWTLSIAAGISAIASFFLQEETYPPILLERKAKRLRKETGNANLRTPFDTSDRKPSAIFARGIIRPLRLLFLSPMVSVFSVYQGISYGLLYLLFTTFPDVFQRHYGFGTGTVGLTYLGLGVGSLVGLAGAGYASDKILKKLAASGTGGFKPEYRLPPLIPAVFFIPIGLFWYGWSAQAGTHWIVPILGTVFIGIGMNTLMMCISTYIIDAYPLYEASAIAAATAVRSLIGALIPLAGLPMYNKLGLGWGNSLLGFLALALCPLPWFFWKYGERIRTSERFSVVL